MDQAGRLNHRSMSLGLFSSAASSAPSAPDLLTNLVSYWRLEELASSIRFDSVLASANDLTDPVGVAQASGKLGYAAQFTTGQYLTKDDNASLRIGASDFTLAAWVYLASKSARQIFAGKYVVSGSKGEWFLEYDNTTDTFRIGVTPNGSTQTILRADTFGSPSTATWYLLIARYDGAHLKIRVNDGADDSVAFTSDIYADDAPFQLSGVVSGSQLPILTGGRVDELALWKSARGAGGCLSDVQLAYLYNSGTGRDVLPIDTGYIFDGDSLTVGAHASDTAHTYPCVCMASMSKTRFYNLAINGKSIQSLVADAAAKVDPYVGAGNVVVIMAGVNDLFVGTRTATQIYNDVVTYCQARQAAGFKVVVCTITPDKASGVPGDEESKRVTVNTSIRTNWASFANALADVGGDATIGQADSPDNGTYYFSDKIHFIDAGYAIIAGIVKTALLTL